MLFALFLLSAEPAAAMRHSSQVVAEADVDAETCSSESLADWFYSSSGFDMSRSEADKLANSPPWVALVQQSVPLDYLKQLRQVAYSSDGLDLDKKDLPSTVLRLAETRTTPKAVKEIRSMIYSSSGADFAKKDAAKTTFDLLTMPSCVQPTVKQLTDLWQFLYTTKGANLGKKQAQEAFKQAAANGVFADQLALAYEYNKGNLGEAMRNSAFVCRRYARDVQPYTMGEFQNAYPDYWVAEWQEAPQEKRVAADHAAYKASEFKDFYPKDFAWRWNSAQVATQQAVADDGKTYTMEGFKSFYRNDWQSYWKRATVAPCVECSG